MLIIGSTVKNMPGRKLRPGAGPTGMDDFGAVVEQAAEAVAAEIAHDAVAMLFGMGLDGVADVAEAIAGPRLLEPEHQAFVGRRRPACFALIGTSPTRNMRLVSPCQPSSNGRHVDVDDVAVLQRLVARDSVAHDMVDRGAAALGVAAIAERRRDRACAIVMSWTIVVDLLGGDAGDDVRTSASRIVGGKARRRDASRQSLRPVKLDHVGARLRPGRSGRTWIYSVIAPKIV